MSIHSKPLYSSYLFSFNTLQLCAELELSNIFGQIEQQHSSSQLLVGKQTIIVNRRKLHLKSVCS